MLPERAFELLAIRREAVIAKGGMPAKKAAATKKKAAARKKTAAKKAPAKKKAATASVDGAAKPTIEITDLNDS
jgi:DNA topoisomerase-1